MVVLVTPCAHDGRLGRLDAIQLGVCAMPYGLRTHQGLYYLCKRYTNLSDPTYSGVCQLTCRPGAGDGLVLPIFYHWQSSP